MFPKTWQILRSLITLIDHFNYYTNTVVQGSSVTSAYKLDYKISDHQIEITSFTKTTSASAVGVIKMCIRDSRRKQRSCEKFLQVMNN